MITFLMKRLLQLIPLLFLISFISFGIYQLAPGDPVMAFVPREEQGDPEAVERIRVQLGLDKPWTVQYVRWLGKTIHGDLGNSMITGRPVAERFIQVIPNTLQLSIIAFVISFAMAKAAGVISAVHRHSLIDQAVIFFSFAGVAVPNFFLGILMILLFAVKLRWLPASGMGPAGAISVDIWVSMRHMIMPVTALVVPQVAGIAAFVRASMVEVLRQDYMRTARSKGLHQRVVVFKHGLRNAMMPVITIVGLSLANFVGGSIVIENLFAWPGMGRVTVQAVFQNDYPVIMAANLIFALLTVIGNMAADIMYAIIDPRVKFS